MEGFDLGVGLNAGLGVGEGVRETTEVASKGQNLFLACSSSARRCLVIAPGEPACSSSAAPPPGPWPCTYMSPHTGGGRGWSACTA